MLDLFSVGLVLKSLKYYLANILLISLRGDLFRGDYEVTFHKHALLQAAKRGIPWDLVEKTIYEGKFERFAKNNVRILKRFNRGTIICIGIIESSRVRILTVEVGR